MQLVVYLRGNTFPMQRLMKNFSLHIHHDKHHLTEFKKIAKFLVPMLGSATLKVSLHALKEESLVGPKHSDGQWNHKTASVK